MKKSGLLNTICCYPLHQATHDITGIKKASSKNVSSNDNHLKYFEGDSSQLRAREKTLISQGHSEN